MKHHLTKNTAEKSHNTILNS